MQHPHHVIADHWQDLLDARLPGTRRPTLTLLGQAVSDERRARDAIERQERSALARGFSPSPADDDVIQTVIDVTAVIHHVEHHARARLALPYLAPAPDAERDVPSACHRIGRIRGIAWPDLVTWIDDALTPAADAVMTVLGLAAPAVPLPEPCPWCGGPLTLDAAHVIGPHVRCDGTGECDAPCSTWLYGRPIWRPEHFDRLDAALTLPSRAPRRPLRVSLRHPDRERRKSLALTA